MEERKIQFRPAFVVLFILLIALITGFLVSYIDLDLEDEAQTLSSIYMKSDYILERSLDSKYDKEFENNPEFIKFVVNIDYIDDYLFSKEFKEKHPEAVVAKLPSDEVQIYSNKKVYEEDYKRLVEMDEILPEYTNQEYFNENTVTNNINTNLEQDFQTDYKPSMSYKSTNNNGWVKGTYSEGNINITSNQQDLKSKEEQKIIRHIEGSVKNRFEAYSKDNIKLSRDTIYYNYDNSSKIVNADFIYEIDFNNSEISAIRDYNAFYQSFLIKSLIGLLVDAILIFLLVTFTNYHKAKKYSTYAGLTSIPIELYVLFFGSLMMILGFGFGRGLDIYNGSAPLIGIFIQNTGYQILAVFIIATLMMTALAYIFMAFKSLFHDGTKAFIFENSITIKVMKWIFGVFRKIWNWIKSIFHGLFSAYGPTSKAFVIGLYLFLLLFGFLASIGFGGAAMFVFMIGALILTALFWLANRYFKDLRDIENATEKIAQGDYKYKIDESRNLYKKMARYLNLTGDSLNLAIGKELKSERLKTELITNVSHDLKTPLTSIINYSQLASEEGANPEEVKKYTKIIHDKSLRLKQLIENLFEVSKATSKNVDLNMQELNFSEMVMQMAGEWTDKFQEKGISIVYNVQDDIILKLDGQQTYRILDNVFSNISKYALENTRVYIDMIQDQKCILKIKNISKYQLNITADELLERFTRGDESRTTEGSGLGLSIASSLTDLQGGKFNIEILGDSFMVEIRF